MIESKCWYETNINVFNAILDDWKFPIANEKVGIWPYSAKNIFKQSWLEYMEGLGLPVFYSVLFYRRPHITDSKAHVDGDSALTGMLGFNWVFGGRHSEMLWYNTPDRPADVVDSPAGPYQAWPINGLTIVDRKSIKSKATLVRIDVPHSIVVKDEQRWCFSVRLPNKFSSWDDSVEFLKSKNLLIER